MMHLVIEIIIISFILILLIIVYRKHERCKKNSQELISFLTKNIEFLIELNKKQEIEQFKKSIMLYSNFQVVVKICNCDYITFFRYDYSKRYITLHFLFTIDINGSILHDSILYDLPLTGSLLSLDMLKMASKNFDSFSIENIKPLNDTIYQALSMREIKKVYYQNVYKDENTSPVGFIAFSYKDPNFVLEDEIKPEILRVIDKIKNYI